MLSGSNPGKNQNSSLFRNFSRDLFVFQIFLYQLFHFFSSLKLAVFLLLALASSLAFGTIQESLHDSKIARDLVYHSWWFALILVFLAVNVFSAALSRLPWKKRHIGFVTTHAGIILILAGSLVTLALGKNGQMTLPLNHSSNSVLLERQFLAVQIPAHGIDALFPIKPWRNKSGNLPLAPWSPVECELTRSLDKAKRVSNIQVGGKGGPGILLHLSGMMGEIEEWLVVGDPKREKLVLGPAEIYLIHARDQKTLKQFLNHPLDSGKNALWVIVGPKEKLYYRLKARNEFVQKGPLVQRAEYRTGWMDFKFSVKTFSEHVASDMAYEPLSRAQTTGSESSAVQLSLAGRYDKQSVWLELGDRKEMNIDGIPVRLTYFLESQTLPFSLKLLKFDVGRYEGSASPASYESRVGVSDFHRQEDPFEAVIKMNHPLRYGGYTFYQAAFEEEDGVPTASVFSVGKDPGIFIKYLGSLILIFGIGVQFFLKKWLVKEHVQAENLSGDLLKSISSQKKPEILETKEEPVSVLVGHNEED